VDHLGEDAAQGVQKLAPPAAPIERRPAFAPSLRPLEVRATQCAYSTRCRTEAEVIALGDRLKAA